MKTIEDLTVKVIYTVVLSYVEVPERVYDALAQCYDEGGVVSQNNMTDEEAIAAEWLNDNIKESDAMEWEYEIHDFNEE